MQIAREIDYRALRLILERSTGGSPLKVEKEVRRLSRAFRDGCLFIPPDEDERQKLWRCEARFMLGDYSDWSGWEFRDEWAATLWNWRYVNPFPVKPWNGLATDHLYVIGEQGIGDEVFFASCLPDCLKVAKRVTVECMPRNRSIFERCFGVETVSSKFADATKRVKQDIPDSVTAWMSMGDLPRMFRLSRAMFPKAPYLFAEPSQVERFKGYEGRTGISWRGAQGEEKRIFGIDGVSLQYDQEWDEECELPDLDLRSDMEGVMGLLANLSKVVTVSTSVAHYACAMGKETHVILGGSRARRENVLPWKWVCGDDGKTPWYPSARVFKNWQHYRAWCKPGR